MRLGASVHAPTQRGRRPSSAVYAVDVNGSVSVIRRSGDPRRIHAWASNSRRPWNLAARFKSTARRQIDVRRVVRIVTLASLDPDPAASQAWMGDAVPRALRPDGIEILRVWACAPRHDIGGSDRSFVVEGNDGWWDRLDVPDLVGIREADRTVVCAESATLWLGPLGAVEVGHYTFADQHLIRRQGASIDNLGEFLAQRLDAAVRLRARASVHPAFIGCPANRLEAGIAFVLEQIDPITASMDDIEHAVNDLADILMAERRQIA